MMFCMKVHKKDRSCVTAICDKEIIGKKLEDKNFCFDISERFYNGKIVDSNGALKAMEDAEILNITGENIVEIAIKNGIVIKENVILVEKVPHAEVF